MTTVKEKATNWKSSFFDQETINRVQELESQPDLLNECFYKNLEFGTGGMRGIMDVGTNRLNKYTIGMATQALANYLLSQFPQGAKVAVAYDCRKNNTLFADTTAAVLSANNIEVLLFKELRPTPELSFAVRHLNCQAGIVITASHNPPEYNGYKVYWEDGGQIVPPHDKNIIDEFNNIDVQEVNFEKNEKLISYIDDSVDQEFWKRSVQTAGTTANGKENLNIVFTSLHGTSITAIPQVLELAGFDKVHVVQEQAIPDGDFPTVVSPNPEEEEAFTIALKQANEIQADLVLGTDPDADRIGVGARNFKGELQLLNGNQIASLMTYYLLKKWKKENKINGSQFIGTTVVTSPILIKMAEDFGVQYKEVLTGFKWIADSIFKNEDKLQFIGGGEESYGYLVGDFVRDKDSVTSALLLCEMANDFKNEGKTFFHILQEIYQKYGFYKEHLIAITKQGISGAEEIKKLIENFRSNPPKSISGEPLHYLLDLQSGVCKDFTTNTESNIDLPSSNVLIFQTVNGTKIAVRPSGTEPKIKFYFSVNTEFDTSQNFEEVERELKMKTEKIIKELHIS